MLINNLLLLASDHLVFLDLLLHLVLISVGLHRLDVQRLHFAHHIVCADPVELFDRVASFAQPFVDAVFALLFSEAYNLDLFLLLHN